MPSEAAIIRYIIDTFPDAQVETSQGNHFFFCGAERMFPFATLVTNDDYDQFSHLNRPDVFRLNIGVGKATFHQLFPEPTEHDHTAFDRLMPHPVYGQMHWVCVLNPSDATFETVRPLLAEAYNRAAR